MPAVFSVNYWFAFAVAFASTSQFFTTILSAFLPLIKRFTGTTESNLSKVKPLSTFQTYLPEVNEVKSFWAASRAKSFAIT